MRSSDQSRDVWTLISSTVRDKKNSYKVQSIVCLNNDDVVQLCIPYSGLCTEVL